MASFVLDQFQALIAGSQKSDEEPATEKAASAVSQKLGYPLTQREKKQAGPLVHYAMGAASGALYGALAEMAPVTATGGGTLFGSALWLVADEVLVPTLGLSKPPSAYPASTHGQSLASHLVYSWTSIAVKKLVLRAI